MTPVVAPAPVTARTELAAYLVLTVHAPSIAEAVEPGQFVNVAIEGRLLRRPFSVYAADAARGTIAIAFDDIGPGTHWLATRAPGDVLDVVGPLGSGFGTADGPALLIGGGYGSAALAFLALELRAAGHSPHAIIGARTADRLFLDAGLRDACASIAITTDDGSRGVRGLVTDVMPDVVTQHGVRTVFACGPNPMLSAVGRAAAAAGVPSRLAVEEFMACGLGVCWTCVLPVRTNGAVKHLRACTEGPVFLGEALAWA